MEEFCETGSRVSKFDGIEHGIATGTSDPDYNIKTETAKNLERASLLNDPDKVTHHFFVRVILRLGIRLGIRLG